VRRFLQAFIARLRRAAQPTPTPTRPAPRSGAAPRTAPGPAPATAPAPTVGRQAPSGRHLEYSPKLDGRADPGEIVWTWVPFEDDPSQGKDRPVLVVGRQGTVVLGLMLSSKQDRDGQHNWFALGSGDWDKEDRPSWLRLDRVLQVPEDGIRREGSILDRKRFDAVAGQLRARYGWA
jgi:PemK-like, MazF-like toxin of type II toxin-antitoxin system